MTARRMMVGEVLKSRNGSLVHRDKALGRTDPSRDDDIDILIRPNDEVIVEYRHAE